MGKILGSWSGMRKYLEQKMLAECLHGRVRYNCTTYVGMDGCHIFEIYIDNKLVKQFSWETVNTYFIKNGYKKNSSPIGIEEYWDEFWLLMDAVPMQSRSEYTDDEFCEALERYRNQGIQDSVNSCNPIVKMFAVLDRRVGKRTLAGMKEALEEQEEWLRRFYRLRLESENILQEIDGVKFRLKNYRDLTWIKRYGNVFAVIDGTGSGCISFGIADGCRKYFVKIAGADTVEAEICPQESIETLKNAVELYQILAHPNLIKLVEYYPYQDYYVAVFEWAEGECLFDHWNFEKYDQKADMESPWDRFKKLPVEKKLSSVEVIFSFLETVAKYKYVAVDFYDGSLMYDFSTDRMTICDIDLFRKQPAVNDIGEDFWGTKRLKAPEEYNYGSCIDEVTNVFTVGALIFNFFGEFTQQEINDRYQFNKFTPCSLDKWELNKRSYLAAVRAIDPDRKLRYQTISDFRRDFMRALS